jgi:predicted small lipoprotein YifL
MKFLLLFLALTACGLKGDPLPVEDTDSIEETQTE